MIDYGTVRSTQRPEEIVIDDYNVTVSTDITEIDVPETDEEAAHTEYAYHMRRYEKDEYIKLMGERSAELENQLTDTQIALCEVYEMIGG